MIAAFPNGLTTQEVAAVLTKSNDRVDRAAAELALLDLVGEGRAERVGMGDDAVWTAPGHALELRSIVDAANATGQPEAQAVGF